VGGYRDDLTPEQSAELDRMVEERLAAMYGYGGGSHPIRKLTAR
jgi:hypothetical protein